MPDLAEKARRLKAWSIPALAGAWFLAFALLTRISALGDAGYTNDEAFYTLVGQRAHEGFLPYVDIWDRKGPGLFLVTYLISGISFSILAYHITALIFAAATAWLVMTMAEHFSTRKGAIFAGTFYLALLPLYGGGAGQSPVFYNLFVALAATIVIASRARLRQGLVGWRIHLAMASAGFAITFKQTAIAESVFLGCYCLWQLRAAALPLRKLLAAGVMMALAGAAPMLLFGLSLALLGHFAEFWQAMVSSNLRRGFFPGADTAARAVAFVALCSPALLLAIAGIVARGPAPWARHFLAAWLCAAAVGVALVPNFFEHYALPLMLPASVAAGRFVLFPQLRPVFAYAMIAAVLLMGPAFDFGARRQSREALAHIEREIRARDPHPRLLIYEGPVYLYRQLDSFPPSPLLFPMHLFFPYEDNAGPHDTAAEVRRILAWQPTVVIKYHDFPAWKENPRTSGMINDYLARCRLWFTAPAVQVFGTNETAVYGDCGGGGSSSSGDRADD